MKPTLLLCPALLLLVAATACSRADDDAKVRAIAKRTAEQLADSWLTTKIQAQYFADDDIKARDLNVRTRDGVVTLTGYVDTPEQRELAVQIARTTDGVRDVSDGLTVRGSAAPESGAVATSGETASPAAGIRQTIDDAQVTARVQSKYFVDEQVKGLRIDVDTRDGVVTLSGEVGSEEERAQALLLARTTHGVQRVEDNLTVVAAPPPAEPAAAPPIEDGVIVTTIQARYFVDTTVKSSAIDVSVKDGVVLLQGRVPDEAARQQALAIARHADGVVQVVDRLTVAPDRRPDRR